MLGVICRLVFAAPKLALAARARNHHYLQLWRLSATLIRLRGLIFVEVDDVLRDERVTSARRGANAT